MTRPLLRLMFECWDWSNAMHSNYWMRPIHKISFPFSRNWTLRSFLMILAHAVAHCGTNWRHLSAFLTIPFFNRHITFSWTSKLWLNLDVVWCVSELNDSPHILINIFANLNSQRRRQATNEIKSHRRNCDKFMVYSLKMILICTLAFQLSHDRNGLVFI